MSAMEYETENGGRYEEEPRYDRDRSASPRGAKRDDNYRGDRPTDSGRDDSRAHEQASRVEDEPESTNTGTNLFVTGIAPVLNEEDVTEMFSKYGEVKHCAIMKDPHTRESRGFGFVEMTTPDQAAAAKDGLSGENVKGRTLSIEMARRARPRTPTPGKYFGPPKREDGRGGRFDDRGYGGGRRDDRRGGDRGYGRRDDRDRDDRRGGDRGDRGYGRRDDRGDDRRGNDRGGDRYGGRDDRRGDRGDRDRRGDDRGSRYNNHDDAGGDRR